MGSFAPALAATTTSLSSGQMAELWITAIASGVLAYVFAVYSRRTIGTYPWRVPPIVWGILGLLIPVLGLLLEAVARLTTRPVPPPAPDPFAGQAYLGSQAPPPGAVPPSAMPGWPPPAPPDSPWGPPPGQAVPPPPGAWQPPGPPGTSRLPADAGSPPAGDETGPSAWQPGAPGAPAAPSWPPPLGPDAFVPPPGAPPPAQPGAPAPSPAPAPPPATPSPVGQAWTPEAAQPAGAVLPSPGGLSQPSYAPAPSPPPLFGWYPDPTGRHEQRYWDGRHWSHRVSDGGVRGDDPLHPDAGNASPGASPPAESEPDGT